MCTLWRRPRALSAQMLQDNCIGLFLNVHISGRPAYRPSPHSRHSTCLLCKDTIQTGGYFHKGSNPGLLSAPPEYLWQLPALFLYISDSTLATPGVVCPPRVWHVFSTSGIQFSSKVKTKWWLLLMTVTTWKHISNQSGNGAPSCRSCVLCNTLL